MCKVCEELGATIFHAKEEAGHLKDRVRERSELIESTRPIQSLLNRHDVYTDLLSLPSVSMTLS